MNEPKDRQYFILRAPDPDELIRSVNDMMVKGWAPVGGVGYQDQDKLWFQAMRKAPIR